MKLNVVVDDTLAVPDSIRVLIGIDRFGRLMFQRRSRVDAMREVSQTAGVGFIHLESVEELDAFAVGLADEPDSHMFLYCPSYVVHAGGGDALATFIAHIQYSPAPLFMPVEGGGGRRGWTLMPTRMMRQYLAKAKTAELDEFYDQLASPFVEVRDRLRLIDVRIERALLDYLSGQFDARHFNAIGYDDYTVTKRSRDRAKMRREFDFYHHVPPHLQMFFVQPFDFEDHGDAASYRMERLSIPDMSLQWIHGAFSQHEFERFLGHIFRYIELRPSMEIQRAQVEKARRALYVDKVRTRIEDLRRTPQYEALSPLLMRACGGIDALVDQYLGLYERLSGRFKGRALVMSHGDPCFSNILYSKTSQFLKLIDPRGADTKEDLFMDPYYDVAKLSHSVLGHYDFINLDRFDISIDDRLGLKLEMERPPPPWAKDLFETFARKAGLDLELLRLCEASLFISMLPLHIDRPRKVLAFAINAAMILRELSRAKGPQ